jgi:hypothetical protein
MTACGGGGGSSSDMSSVTDSDGDGFYDAIDPAPNDASNPGDFSSPEKILANPSIQVALQAARDHGMELRADLGHNPPDLTGYYSTSLGGRTVATESGISIGNTYVASESRVRTEGERYEKALVGYYSGKSISFSYNQGSFLRGEGNYFTIYSPYKETCTEIGANYVTYGVRVESAVRDPQSGTLSSRSYSLIRLTSSGTLTPACDTRLAGDAKSKWTVGYGASSTKIDDASDLNYMCVDDNKAYIPNETWTNSDKQSCRCTTNYEVSCK